MLGSPSVVMTLNEGLIHIFWNPFHPFILVPVTPPRGILHEYTVEPASSITIRKLITVQEAGVCIIPASKFRNILPPVIIISYVSLFL